jgi:hypothetical protein
MNEFWRQECAKTHLRASGSQKNFSGGYAPWTTKGGEGEGDGEWEGRGRMGERRERVEGGKQKGKGVGKGEEKEGGKGGEEREGKGREEKGRDLIKCAVEKFSYFKA